jgi:hypothetical protein
MTEVNDTVRMLCTLGASAVRRYVELTGLSPWKMPEYFMPAFTVDHMPERPAAVSARLEVGFDDLVEWNVSVRARRAGGEPATDNDLLSLAPLLGRRVDMVLFQSDRDLLALVEYKRGHLSSYREPACPWGIVCGCTGGVHRDWQKNTDMTGTKDRWFESPIDLVDSEPLFFCARLFARGSDESRLAQLQTVSPVAPFP